MFGKGKDGEFLDDGEGGEVSGVCEIVRDVFAGFGVVGGGETKKLVRWW